MRTRQIARIGMSVGLLIAVGCQPAGLPPTRSAVPAPTPDVAATSTPGNAIDASATPDNPPAAFTPVSASGIQLSAIIGPTCPGPERSDQVCEQPYSGTFSIQNERGEEVARVVTGDDGQAVIAVPPGKYIITPKIEGRFPHGAPVEVTIGAGESVTVQIALDSGMR